jgi:putative transcriptional regulator
VAKPSKILAGLQEAVDYARGNRAAGRAVTLTVNAPIDVRAIREARCLSQSEFAEKYGFSVATVMDWEHGRRIPTGASRILLLVIAKHPDAVDQVLAA